MTIHHARDTSCSLHATPLGVLVQLLSRSNLCHVCRTFYHVQVDQVSSIVLIETAADGWSPNLAHIPIEGAVPMERRAIVHGLRQLADAIEEQAEQIGD